MPLATKLRHWFTPHLTNNFRAKLLHNSGIFAIIGIVVVSNIFLRIQGNTELHVLGFTSSITIDEVVKATNAERANLGLKPLSYSEKLADAARRKAANMFAENYWAHNSPSGKSPWIWFQQAGYNYVFAGENLAKDFGNTGRLISAWMASPTHKENIVNSKYSEIGIAVVPGTLQGQETMLVVQLFGTPRGGAVATTGSQTTTQVTKKAVIPAVAEVKGQVAEITEEAPESTPEPSIAPANSPLPATPPRFSQFDLARALNLATTALFILVLVLDLCIAESKRLSRRVGNNWAHIVFINIILLATTIVNAGKIM